MEKSVVISTSDGKKIFGTLRRSKTPSRGILIFVHGFAGTAQEHLLYNGAHFFSARGYDTFRFDLYRGGESRRFIDCTLQIHGADLTRIFKYFRRKYKKVCVVGHSLGGLTVLASDVSLLDGIFLWECSTSGSLRKKHNWLKPLKKLNCYVTEGGIGMLTSSALVESWRDFPLPHDAAKVLTKPLFVGIAGRSILMDAGNDYYQYAPTKIKNMVVIPNCRHCFDEDDSAFELLRASHKFLKKLF